METTAGGEKATARTLKCLPFFFLITLTSLSFRGSPVLTLSWVCKAQSRATPPPRECPVKTSSSQSPAKAVRIASSASVIVLSAASAIPACAAITVSSVFGSMTKLRAFPTRSVRTSPMSRVPRTATTHRFRSSIATKKFGRATPSYGLRFKFEYSTFFIDGHRKSMVFSNNESATSSPSSRGTLSSSDSSSGKRPKTLLTR
mmetsp:Transcript_1258/g.4246  ORF Transcript_1258/g.4246 Transcript_1258/m.4246 type:complete len:202 (-) Transcript_1258:418-1023(-)